MDYNPAALFNVAAFSARFQGNVSRVIELDWRAASGAGANDGGLTFWIDGSQVADLTGIDDRVRDLVTYNYKFRLVFWKFSASGV